MCLLAKGEVLIIHPRINQLLQRFFSSSSSYFESSTHLFQFSFQFFFPSGFLSSSCLNSLACVARARETVASQKAGYHKVPASYRHKRSGASLGSPALFLPPTMPPTPLFSHSLLPSPPHFLSHQAPWRVQAGIYSLNHMHTYIHAKI